MRRSRSSALVTSLDLELGPGQIGLGLEQQRSGTGDVRGGHRRAGEDHVVVADRLADLRTLGARGGDVDARRDDLRLHAEPTESRADPGEVGQVVLLVDRPD